jgi:hypothetical protein
LAFLASISASILEGANKQDNEQGTRNDLRSRAARLQDLFHFAGQMRERCGLVHREIGQNFPVERYVRQFQTVHELAVAQTVCASGRSDPDYPQRAKVAFPELSARKSEVQRPRDLLFRVPVELALGQAVSASQFQDPFSLVQPFVSTFSARHKSSILRVSALA